MPPKFDPSQIIEGEDECEDEDEDEAFHQDKDEEAEVEKGGKQGEDEDMDNLQPARWSRARIRRFVVHCYRNG
eukprot:757906-Hanusia_phi.AAC.2